MQHLVVMDVPGIKEYVFGTDRLVQIRGASALLDHLNRAKTLDYLENKLGGSQVQCVFANGGAGQFIIDADPEVLYEVLEGLKGYYCQESQGGLRLICGVAPLSLGTYLEVLDRAFLNLKEEREEKPVRSSTMLHTGYIRECDTCSGLASQLEEYGGDQLTLCDTCAEKLAKGKERGLWQEFMGFLQAQGISEAQAEAYRPRDFEEIGNRCQTNKGYTALVYADGNAMGRLIKQIENAEQFVFFSETVDRSIREACYEALFEECKACGPGEVKIPADLLLLGGDDLMVYLSADTALPFALAAAQKFEDKTQEAFSRRSDFAGLLNNKGVTISLGIAIGKSHTPFAIMLDQAEELLKSAKAAGALDPRAKNNYVPTYFDYHFTSYFNQINVSDCRQTHLQLEGPKPLRLYMKPYSLDNAQALLEHALRLGEIPRSRLHRIGHAPSLGKLNGTLEFLKTYVRTRKEEHQQAIRAALAHFDCDGIHMPWKEEADAFTTVLVDLIEITDFIAV